MQRTLIIGGREIVISSLGESIDEAFEQLHAAYFGNASISWESFSQAAFDYFNKNLTPAAHDAYFSNFTVIWSDMLSSGRLTHAEHFWEQALQTALLWEQNHPPQLLHKGTPYYFWAMTALLRGDLDNGYLLIHQSLDEDIRTSGQPTPDTPGFALVTLNYEKVQQAFRPWVLEQATFLNSLVLSYAATYQRNLSVGDVRRRFLATSPDVDNVFLFTYTIARLKKICQLPLHATQNNFAGQLQTNLLFDVTLVIDNAIKAKNASDWKFADHVECLLNSAGHPLTRNQLAELNDQFKKDFDSAISRALDGTMTLTPSKVLDRLQCDVALAYGVRNHGAHKVGSAPTMWKHFPSVQQALFRVLCATIDYLY